MDDKKEPVAVTDSVTASNGGPSGDSRAKLDTPKLPMLKPLADINFFSPTPPKPVTRKTTPKGSSLNPAFKSEQKAKDGGRHEIPNFFDTPELSTGHAAVVAKESTVPATRTSAEDVPNIFDTPGTFSPRGNARQQQIPNFFDTPTDGDSGKTDGEVVRAKPAMSLGMHRPEAQKSLFASNNSAELTTAGKSQSADGPLSISSLQSADNTGGSMVDGAAGNSSPSITETIDALLDVQSVDMSSKMGEKPDGVVGQTGNDGLIGVPDHHEQPGNDSAAEKHSTVANDVPVKSDGRGKMHEDLSLAAEDVINSDDNTIQSTNHFAVRSSVQPVPPEQESDAYAGDVPTEANDAGKIRANTSPGLVDATSTSENQSLGTDAASSHASTPTVSDGVVSQPAKEALNFFDKMPATSLFETAPSPTTSTAGKTKPGASSTSQEPNSTAQPMSKEVSRFTEPANVSSAASLFSTFSHADDPVADFFQSVDVAASSLGHASHHNHAAGASDLFKSTQNEALKSGWTECFDQTSGYPYYYNTITGESSWEKPRNFIERVEPAPAKYAPENQMTNSGTQNTVSNRWGSQRAQAKATTHAASTAASSASKRVNRNAHLLAAKKTAIVEQVSPTVTVTKKKLARGSSHLAHLAQVRVQTPVDHSQPFPPGQGHIQPQQDPNQGSHGHLSHIHSLRRSNSVTTPRESKALPVAMESHRNTTVAGLHSNPEAQPRNDSGKEPVQQFIPPPPNEDTGNEVFASEQAVVAAECHEDGAALSAIRKATKSIFEDLNSNLESIKKLDRDHVAEEKTAPVVDAGAQNTSYASSQHSADGAAENNPAANNGVSDFSSPSIADGTTPNAWEKLFDPSTGYPYYFNSITGESSWERPYEFAENAGSPGYQGSTSRESVHVQPSPGSRTPWNPNSALQKKQEEEFRKKEAADAKKLEREKRAEERKRKAAEWKKKKEVEREQIEAERKAQAAAAAQKSASAQNSMPSLGAHETTLGGVEYINSVTAENNVNPPPPSGHEEVGTFPGSPHEPSVSMPPTTIRSTPGSSPPNNNNAHVPLSSEFFPDNGNTGSAPAPAHTKETKPTKSKKELSDEQKAEKKKRALERQRKAQEWKKKKEAERMRLQKSNGGETGSATPMTSEPPVLEPPAPFAQAQLTMPPPQTMASPPTEINICEHADYRGPVISFGFGGLTVTTGAAASSSFGYAQNVEVHVKTIEAKASGAPYIERLVEFPGPLKCDIHDHFGLNNTKSSLRTFLQNRIDKSKHCGDLPETGLIWCVLNVILQFEGRTLASPTVDLAFSNSLIELLTAYNKEAMPEDATLEGLTADAPVDITAERYGEKLAPALSLDEEKATDGASKPDSVSEPTEADEAMQNTPEGGDAMDEVKERQASPDAVIEEIAKLVDGKNEVEALELAVNRQLWAHAILLAQNISRSEYERIVGLFASQTFKKVHTLSHYYVQKARVVFQEKPVLRSWSSTLQEILQNGCKDAVQQIGALGDKLCDASMFLDSADDADAHVAAAHVCYLLACRPIQKVSTPRARFVLVGANHFLRPEEYVSDDAVQCTEIFEFLVSHGKMKNLCPKPPSFVPLQRYKLLYGMKLADAGRRNLANKYANALKTVKKNPSFSIELDAFIDRLTGEGSMEHRFDAARRSMSGPPPASAPTLSFQTAPAMSHLPVATEPTYPNNTGQYQQHQDPQYQDQPYVDQINRDQYQQPVSNQGPQFPPQHQPPANMNAPASMPEVPRQTTETAENQDKRGSWFSSLLVKAIHGGDEDEEEEADGSAGTMPPKEAVPPQSAPPPQYQQPIPPSPALEPAPAQPTRKKSSFFDMGDDDDVKPVVQKKVEEPPKKEPSTEEADSSEGGGLTGWLRGAFMSKKDKDKKATLGKKNDAYFDKDLNRWVFPDSPASAAPAPPAGPPIGSTSQANANPSGPGDANGANAVAALMAPPPRRGVSNRYATFGSFVSDGSAPAQPGMNGPPGFGGPPGLNGPPGNVGGGPPKIMSFGPKKT
jgi:hypothetical protein